MTYIPIIISHYQFLLSAPYSPGDILSPTDAAILNYNRARVARVVFSRWVAAAESDGHILTPSELADLQRRITEHETGRHYGRPTMDCRAVSRLETFRREVATEAVITGLGASSPEVIEKLLESGDSVIEGEARRRLLALTDSIDPDHLGL